MLVEGLIKRVLKMYDLYSMEILGLKSKKSTKLVQEVLRRKKKKKKTQFCSGSTYIIFFKHHFWSRIPGKKLEIHDFEKQVLAKCQA